MFEQLTAVDPGLIFFIFYFFPVSFLDASIGYDFVMSSILAFSATHLAWTTKSVETKNLAYYHRGVALKGLHGAIGKFSRENSDPILAASILLSWQASDW